MEGLVEGCFVRYEARRAVGQIRSGQSRREAIGTREVRPRSRVVRQLASTASLGLAKPWGDSAAGIACEARLAARQVDLRTVVEILLAFLYFLMYAKDLPAPQVS